MGDYNDGLCHIAAIRRGKLGLGVDGVRIGQWVEPDFSQSSNAPKRGPIANNVQSKNGFLKPITLPMRLTIRVAVFRQRPAMREAQIQILYQIPEAIQLRKFTCCIHLHRPWAGSDSINTVIALRYIIFSEFLRRN